MARSLTHKFRKAVLAAALLSSALLLSPPAQSRNWSNNPLNLANDYLTIVDNRGGKDLVVLIWAASPLIPDGPRSADAKTLIDQYVILGIVHARTGVTGDMTYDKIPSVDALDGEGKHLNFLENNSLPPRMVGIMATAQSMFSRSLGPMGQGMQWFIYDAGSVNPCKEGGLSIPYDGQTYTYKTPIPGCR